MNIKLLEYYLSLSEISKKDLAKIMNISYMSILRKFNLKSDFALGEVKKIKQILHLTNEEMLEIFFDGGFRRERQ